MGEAEYIGHLVENLLMGIAPTLLEWKHEQDKILYNVPHRTCALIAQSVEHSAVTRHHLAQQGDSEVTERSRDRNSLGAILFVFDNNSYTFFFLSFCVNEIQT